MLKYVDTKVTFAEVPDEITLCINISGCPCHCKGCHSEYLAQDIGENLDFSVLDKLIQSNIGITCVCFMGGDSSPVDINCLAEYLRKCYPKLQIAWYSGKQDIPNEIDLKYFNFIKLGPYVKELGPLTSKDTNQRFYKVESFTKKLIDITYKFQKT